MKINEAIIKLSKELNDDEVSRLEVKMLMKQVFEIDDVSLILKYNEEIDVKQFKKIKEKVIEIKNGRPIQYILKNTEFMSLDFYVDENVLIPRADTEILVERVLEMEKEKIKILDMCTGSGCIAISLKKYNELYEVIASDISKDALKVAKRNATYNDVDVKFILSDVFYNIEEKFEVIVSNPPYIKYTEYMELEKKVLMHEPKDALHAEDNGLFFYKQISKKANEYLTKGGRLYFEIGYNQALEVKEIMQEYNFINIRIEKDLKGKDRVIYGTLK